MKTKLLLLLFLSFFQCLYSQSPNWNWAERAGGNNKDEGYDIATDALGNSYVTGYFEGSVSFGNNIINSVGNWDIFLTKYDANGNVIWARSAGGTGYDQGRGVSIDASGNAYVTGYFHNTVIFGSDTLTSPLNSDIFVAKYDTNGNVIWAKRAGGSGVNHGYDISVDVSGNTYVTGCFSGTATFGNDTLNSAGQFIVYDIFVAKYDTNGNVIWAKRAGGSSFDEGKGISLDTSGNAYVTGYFEGIATFGSDTLISTGNADIFVAKYDVNGNVIWVRKAGSNNNDFGYGISVNSSGTTHITGSFIGSASFGNNTLISAGNNDIFVAKYDTNGNIIWVKRAGGSNQDFGQCISIDTSGNAFIAGNFAGTAIFGSDTLISAGVYDIFVTKYDANGNVLWVKKAGGIGWDIGYGISLDASANAYLTGYFESSATFGSHSLNSTGQSDIFVARLGNLTTSLNEHIISNKSELTIFPNPNKGNFFVQDKNIQNITVLDISGKVIFSQNVNKENTVMLQLTNTDNGIYIVRIQTQEAVLLKKVIIQ